MGVCNCNQNRNGVITGEMFIPGEVRSNANNITNNQNSETPSLILTTKKGVVEEDSTKKSQMHKNLIKFTYLNDQSTLTSAIKEMNQTANPQNKLFNRLIQTTKDNVYDEQQGQPITILSNLSVNRTTQNTNNTAATGVGGEEMRKVVSKTPVLLGRSRTNIMGVVVNKLPGHRSRRLSTSKGDPNNNNNYNYYTAVQEITEEEDLLLKQWIKRHFLFDKFDDSLIQRIIESLSLYQLEEDKFIFKEGETGNEFYIIKSGKLEIKTKIPNIVLTQGDTFGELALLKRRCFRTYAALTKTQVEIFALTMENYTKILKESGVSSITKKSNQEKEKIMKEVTNHPLLKYLSDTQKDNLSLMATYHVIKDNTLLISSKQRSKKKETQKPLFPNPKALIFPIEGEVIESFKSSSSSSTSPSSSIAVTKGNGAGFLYTIFKVHENSDYSITMEKDMCTCILLSENALIESMGTNYQFDIIFSFFCSKISKSEIIMQLTPIKDKNKTDTLYYYNFLFQGFTMKIYNQNDVVFPQSSFENKKHIVLLNGELLNSKSQKTIGKNNIYGDKMINSQELVNYDIIAKTPNTVTLENSWKNTKEILKCFPENKHLFSHYESLTKVAMFQNLEEMEIFNMSMKVKKTKFKAKETIIKEGTMNEEFYFITKGRVKVKLPNQKTLRVYDTGNCFGEISLLYDSPSPYSIIAKENTVCYVLPKEHFIELLKDKKVNDFMKQKMLMEDNDITLSDLYYLSYLGRGRFGNVCLVHNQISFYAAKAISKLAAEKQKSGVKNLLNEKKTMISVDHPFIVKIVKTLKKDNWCFFLQEFIIGKNFAEYLDTRTSKHNLYETKFYGACLFAIMHYLNKNKIIHRDIKPSNIMLEYHGYLKLIDFGTARKIKNYSQTVIGTPNFIAPEVLLGKGYSFPCDYWSIGVCLYYIYFSILPFGNKAIELIDIYKDIIENDPEYPYDTPSEIKALINGLLKKKPSQRTKSFDMVQKQLLYKDFPWDDLLKFNVKPFYVPPKDQRDDPENLKILKSPFEVFMESEKFETIQMQTLKINNTKVNRTTTIVNAQWFNDF